VVASNGYTLFDWTPAHPDEPWGMALTGCWKKAGKRWAKGTLESISAWQNVRLVINAENGSVKTGLVQDLRRRGPSI
jgi:hypothetical protein